MDIQKVHKRVQLDHNFIVGQAVGSSLRDAGTEMMRNVGGGCVMSRAMDLPDVSALTAEAEPEDVTPPSEDDPDKEDHGDSGEGNKRKGTVKTGGSAKNGKWFDYDKLVSRAQSIL